MTIEGWTLPIVLGALIAADGAAAGTMEQRMLAPGSHPGSRERAYQVFVPDGVGDDAAAPVVMVLHGCQQTEQNVIAETRFTEIAERDGVIVVFPFITSHPFLPPRAPNCWGFFIEQHRHEGLGEPADLRRILQAVEDEFPVDPNRRYVTGLSSGAAMAVVMAVAYSEDIAAAGAVAGLPFTEDACAVQNACFTGIEHKPVAALVEAMRAEQEDPDEQGLVPLMVIHSVNDTTVPIKNGHNLRDSWLAHYEAGDAPLPLADCSADGVTCEHERFIDDDGRTVVETALYEGPAFGTTHFWVGDNAGTFADPNGPSATDLLWGFFQQHSKAATAVEIEFDPVEVAGDVVTVRGRVGAEAAIEEVLVRLEGDPAQAERAAEGSDTFVVQFDAVPDDHRYVPVARVVLEDGTSRTASGSEFAVGQPPEEVEMTVATGSIHEHVVGGRIAIQQPPCIVGLGACDADFNRIFAEKGLRAFDLHQPVDADRWYFDPANIPSP